MHGPVSAREVMNFLHLATASGFVRHFTPQFHFRIITADPDDGIFADCAIAAATSSYSSRMAVDTANSIRPSISAMAIARTGDFFPKN